jgi:flagellar export protein FliJ
MAAFRFRLASVLRYRNRIREERQSELQTLEKAKDHFLSEIHRQEQLIVQHTHVLENQRGTILSALEVRLQGDFSHHLSLRINEQYKLLALLQSRLNEKREEVLQADTDVKSLEQLQTRLWDRHRYQENHEELKQIDEIGQRQFSEKKRERG